VHVRSLENLCKGKIKSSCSLSKGSSTLAIPCTTASYGIILTASAKLQRREKLSGGGESFQGAKSSSLRSLQEITSSASDLFSSSPVGMPELVPGERKGNAYQSISPGKKVKKVVHCVL